MFGIPLWAIGAGVVAYFLLKGTTASAATQPTAPGQQVQTSTEAVAIMNYMDKAMALVGHTVRAEGGFYVVVDPRGVALPHKGVTLAALMQALQALYKI